MATTQSEGKAAMGWWLNDAPFLGELDAAARERLAMLKPVVVPKRTVLFSPGEEPRGFVLVLSGRVGVYLTGESGRELLLYSVTPGETCVQTTLGILGGQPYSGEAIAETDVVAVMLPLADFARLMDTAPGFRRFVFRAFAERLGDVMHVLEQVAFVKVERRLARALLERADASGTVTATHQDLATAIGSVREVVSRRLENMASGGLLTQTRGEIRIVDRGGLSAMAQGN